LTTPWSTQGKEELDNTLVHPESYNLARWLLKEQGVILQDRSSIKNSMLGEPSVLLSRAMREFDISKERVESVQRHLIDSMTDLDPRVKESASMKMDGIGGTTECMRLPRELLSLDNLASACPVRKIVAVVRNVVDFGVFVDAGLERDALIHNSRLGNVNPMSMLIGSEVGIDILMVRQDGKISASLTGFDYPLDNRKKEGAQDRLQNERPSKRPRNR